MDNGSLNIWTSYFEEAVFNAEIGQILNTASFGVFNELLIVSCITRQNKLLVCQVGLSKILDSFLEERQYVHTNGNNFRLLVNLELVVETPYLPATSLTKIKLRFHNRVIQMDDQRLVVTSKDGNMYLTDIESLMQIKEDRVVMRPAAYEDQENPYYEMLDENPHFKNIYFAGLLGETFIAIGMDRLVSFWNVNSYRVQYDFNIKCLGSKATCLAVSPLEPQSFLFACNDHTMRLWNTGKKANRFITTILWKGLDRKRVRALDFHPEEEGVVLLCSENDLSLMDVHAHTLIAEFKVQELYDGIPLFGRWLHRKVVEKLIDSKFEQAVKKLIGRNKGYKNFLKNQRYNNTRLNSKYKKLNQKYQKELNPHFLYVSFIQNKGFIIADFKLGTVFCVNYSLEKFVSNLEVVDLLASHKALFLFFGDKKGNVVVIRCLKGKFSSMFLYQVHTALVTSMQGNVRKQKKDSFLLATGSYDRTIKISRLSQIRSAQMKPAQFKTLFTFRHKFKISHIDWDPFHAHRFLAVCQKHVTVQVWTLDPEEEMKNEKDEGKQSLLDFQGVDRHYVANIRGHKGFITAAMWSRHDPDHVLTSSDDQSVKIWNLCNIKYRKPPTKKKQDNLMGEVIMEEEEFNEDERMNAQANRY